VLLVVDSLDIGGAERHVVDLAVALRRMGRRVTVACSQDGPLRSVLDAEGIAVHVLMDRLVKRRVSIEYALRLRAVLTEGFDLVHAHLYASAVAAAIATLGTARDVARDSVPASVRRPTSCPMATKPPWNPRAHCGATRERSPALQMYLNRKPIPLVLTEHSEGCWQGRAARSISRWTNRRAAAVIAVSETIRRRLIADQRAPVDRIVTIPNGVTAAPLHRRARWQEGPLVGVVARLEPEKGVDVFLEAAAEVARAIPACRFLVVGDGSRRGQLAAQAERLGVADRIHFPGWRMAAREIIGSLDVLAVPSRSEGMPLVTLEAMSAGVPVVGTIAGGIPEQIDDGYTGLLTPSGDPRALAAACVALLRDPTRARCMGEAGRVRATSQFGHERMVSTIEALYADVLQRRLSARRRPLCPSTPTG
jgi:glycosyltransferase involved in cell wall biosynthesis